MAQYDLYTVDLYALRKPSTFPLYTKTHTGNINDYSGHGLWIKQQYPGGLTTIALQGAKAAHTKVFWEGVRINSPLNGGFNFNNIGLSRHQTIRPQYNHSTIDAQNIGGSIHISDMDMRRRDRGRFLSIQRAKGSFGLDYLNIATNFDLGSSRHQLEVQKQSIANEYPYTHNSKTQYLDNASVSLKQIKWIGSIQSEGKAYRIFSKSGLLMNENHSEIPASVSAATSEAYSKTKNGIVFTQIGIQTNRHWSYKQNSSFQFQDYNYYLNLQSKPSPYIFNKLNSTHSLKYNTESRQIGLHLMVDYDYIFTSKNTLGHAPKDHRYQAHLGLSLFNQLIKAYIGGIRSENLNSTDLSWSFIGTHSLHTPVGLYTVQLTYHRKQQLPTFNDLYYPIQGNPSLNTERANILGIAQSLTNLPNTFYRGLFYRISLDANYSYIQDLILWRPNASGTYTPLNISRVEQYTLRPSLELAQFLNIENHTYQFTTEWYATYQYTQDIHLGKQLIYTPNLNLGIALLASYSYAHMSDLISLRMSYDYQSASYIDFQNESLLDHYYLLHLESQTNLPSQLF